MRHQNRIKKLLNERGSTQTWLARKIGVSVNTLHGYANNRTQPSLDVAHKIAKALNVTIEELIEIKK